jgi:uncharacterized membrane-anchored protein YhcB (DUF1043 family)
MREKILYGLIITLIIFLVGCGIKNKMEQDALIKEINSGNETIVEMDKVKKEKDGQYAKLVDYFETQKSLNDDLKDSNKELYKQLKKNDEKLLQITNIVATFEGKLEQGKLEHINDSTFKMDIFYPTKDKWFINWKGNILTKSKSYDGKWIFGDLKLQAVLTETKRGIWNARLIGPDFLKIDSMEIKSLPPEDYVKDENKDRKLEFLVGGGYRKSFNPSGSNAVTIGAAVQWKNRSMLLVDAGTDNSVGLKYLYKFKSAKK